MSVLFDLARTLAAFALMAGVTLEWPLWITASLVAFITVGLALRLWPGWWKDDPA